MKIEIALTQILSEVERAEKLHPAWPTNPIHQAAIVIEEAGELIRACNCYSETKTGKKDVATEAVQTAASAIRFLKNLELEETAHE